MIVAVNNIYSQPPHTFTQYTSEDGLSHNIIQSIHQDKKGLLWFATWDGLYKFDGYTFKNYKAHSGDNIELANNRMGYLNEDLYGFIWVQSYDHKIYRFDPGIEQFESVPYPNYLSKDIYLLPSGDVWITTTHNELIRVKTDPSTHIMTAINFSKHHQIENLQEINNICQDKKGNQWLLAKNGLYRVSHTSKGETVTPFFSSDNDDKQCFFYDMIEDEDIIYFTSNNGIIKTLNNNQFQSLKLPTKSSITFIRKIGNEQFFIGTDSDGFFTYNIGSKEVQHYNTKTHSSLKDDHIKDVYIDKRNEVWLRLSEAGVTHFNPKNKIIDYFILKDKYGKDIVESRIELNICEDKNGYLWIHPPGGGFAWYDRKNKCLIPFYNSSLQDGWNYDNRVTTIFSDKQGNLWLCSYKNGLEKITFNTTDFNLYPIYPKDAEHPGNNTRAMFQDRDGYIWVGNKDKLIRVYDKDLKYIGNLTAKGQISQTSKDEFGAAYSFTQDHNGTIWIGTKGKGLIAVSPTRLALNYDIRHYTSDDKNIYSISGNDIYSLHTDKNNKLWIATFGEGINYLDLNLKDAKFINHRNLLKNYPIEECYRTRFVTSDKDGKIWIGSAAGLLMCENSNSSLEKMRFQRFIRIPGDKYSLSNNDVHNIFLNNNSLYVATFGGGLNKLISLENGQAKFQSHTTSDGLSSDILLSIENDNKQNLWITAEEELYKFNPVNENFTIYQSKFFPQRIRFNEGAALHTKDGKLLFNTMQGIFYFHPDSIKESSYIPPIVFTDFHLTEKATGSNTTQSSITNIDDIKIVEIPHDQNGFNIQFAALDMKYPKSISYAYQLEGFDKAWNYIGNHRNAIYTNLPKGDYILKVKSTNSDGKWVENTRTLKITILPSFWETIWAYIIYFLLGIILILITAYIFFVFFKLKHKVVIEQEVSDIKLRFFTNISHELRTPLTLIVGPIEQILNSTNIKDAEKEQLKLVKKNTNRMLHLVNQILDFRKIQNKKMKLRVQQVNLIPFVRNIMDSFNNAASEHQIDFKLETQEDSLNIWADADKLEKILFNLLSNAFKYTPRGKQIRILVANTDKEVIISVIDQGVGISESKQKSLFIRFETLIDKNILNHPSTGIGLSLVKELIDMHHGKIQIDSKQGEGSSFSVHLLKGKEHFDEMTEFILEDDPIVDINQIYPDSSLFFTDDNLDHTIDSEKQTLLIVEDNPELRFFLKTIFINQFNIIEADNGSMGIEKSQMFIPDIIISDVMMPEKDGIEMTQELREDIRTSHIPIILLTAKSTIESKIQGMEYGADDYITKPFSGAYLKARIYNLLEQRKKLQTLYCTNLQPTNLNKESVDTIEQNRVNTPELLPNDHKFMTTIMRTIEENIDNGYLKVEDIATEVNMSRSVFFKKLKSITGMSPIKFLMDIRMKRAAQLIEGDEYNFSQIAYMVGINDPHYFSKCFKQQYGITPSEYKEKSQSK